MINWRFRIEVNTSPALWSFFVHSALQKKPLQTRMSAQKHARITIQRRRLWKSLRKRYGMVDGVGELDIRDFPFRHSPVCWISFGWRSPHRVVEPAGGNLRGLQSTLSVFDRHGHHRE